jgi:two-component system, sensor histidine kinase PdtaS
MTQTCVMPRDRLIMNGCLIVAFCLVAVHACDAQDRSGQSIPVLLGQLKSVTSDTGHLHLLLDISDAYIEKPGEDHRDLDTALLLIRQVENNNRKVNDAYIRALCLLFEAKANREKGNRVLGKTYAARALQAFRSLKALYPSGLAYADYEAAKYLDYDDPGQDSQRIALYQEAIPLFEITGKKEMEAEVLKTMADCMENLPTSRGDEGLVYLLRALTIYQSIHRTDLSDLYTLLSTSYTSIGDHRSALKYGLLAVRDEERKSSSMALCTVYNRVGLIYYHLNEFEMAEDYWQKAFGLAERFHDTVAICQTGVNEVTALNGQRKYDSSLQLLNRLVQRYPFADRSSHTLLVKVYMLIYVRTGRLHLAKPYLQQIVHMDSVMDTNDWLHILTVSGITEYFLKTKEYDRVREYVNRFSVFCNRNSYAVFLYPEYYKLFQADSAQGRLGEAITHFQQFVQLRDSLLDVNKRRQLAALQLDYETEKKDKDIQVLTQKQQLGQLALRQASLIRNFIIAGAILLLVLLLVTGNRYRLKQRSNKQLNRLLNEKEWLVKEIHHRVKNNLHMISGLLDGQAGFLQTSEAVSAIRDSQHRVDAMSMVHQKLYQTANLSITDMAVYINELVAHLESSFNTGKRVRFILELERLQMDLTRSIPIGLILNEAITNALKYGFPDDRRGEVIVTLQHFHGQQFLLSVEDNGVGIRLDGKKKDVESMGMTLMRGLSEDMGGSFAIANGQGTKITILFVYEPVNNFA